MISHANFNFVNIEGDKDGNCWFIEKLKLLLLRTVQKIQDSVLQRDLREESLNFSSCSRNQSHRARCKAKYIKIAFYIWSFFYLSDINRLSCYPIQRDDFNLLNLLSNYHVIKYLESKYFILYLITIIFDRFLVSKLHLFFSRSKFSYTIKLHQYSLNIFFYN